jgi:RNA polymerase sigma-70 factor (ECF subfamily)
LNEPVLSSSVLEGASNDARLRAIVTHEYDFVNRAMRGLGVVDADVDDATQQTFIVLMRKLEGVPHGGERGFLFRTAVKIASNVRRGRSRRREAHPNELAAVTAATNPEDLLDQRRALAVLDQVLEDMPMDLRAVFVLSEVEQMTAPEIASVLEIPLGTVASRLRRARSEFQRRVRSLPVHRGEAS